MARPSAESEELLLSIAGLVSDREEIAWPSVLEGAPEVAARLDTLKRLAILAAVHEQTRSESSTPPPRRGTTATAVEASPEAATAGATWGPLTLLEAVGRGGFGRVYRAFDPQLDREVALKLWDPRGPDDRARHLAEARALARVRHTGLPVVHGIDEHQGRIGMWTELVRGRTLEELLAAHGPLGAREAAQIGIEVCRALAAVHLAGLVHRDVKTDNVMREEGGRVVLLDLGLAIPNSAPHEHGRAAGTLASMAPELLRGERATVASDIYAVGVMLYRLVTRAYPQDPRSLDPVDRPPSADAVALEVRRPDLPARFVRIVQRATSAKRTARYASAEILERVLGEVVGPAAVDLLPAESSGVAERARLLPRSATRFIGRDEELWSCLESVRAHPLVTLVGPGGCGKTRLALRAAERMAESAECAVAFADLSALDAPAGLEPEVLRAIDGPPAHGRDHPREHLARVIGSRALLLVLDNCERLTADAGRLATDLIEACPQLRILATSRASLRVAGERLMELPTLALPPEEGSVGAAGAGTFDAVRLFVDRARMVRSDFRLTDENVAAVVEICRRADGLPLAIELAAARARVLTPEEIRDRFARGPAVLGRGGFSTSSRHRTLDASIRWSYDMLPEEDRRLVDALAVFAGTWTLEAANRVCLQGTDELEALEQITDLIEGSLVATTTPRLGISRYRFLDTLHRFALERLQESGRLVEMQGRHFDFFMALAEEAEPRMWGPEQAGWAIRLEADHPNFIAALAWSRGDAARAGGNLRLAGALARFWSERGHLIRGREALRWALDHNRAEDDPRAYARALLGAGTLAVYQSDQEEARRACERALEILRGLDELPAVARTLVTLGVVAHDVADYGEARTRYAEALEIFTRLGEARGIANVHNNLGAIAWRQGEWAEAHRQLSEALGRAGAAQDPGLRVLTLTNLGFVALHQGRMTDAAVSVAEALRLVREHRMQRHGAASLEACAAILARHHESARAARLYAAADELRSRLGHRREPAWQKAHGPMRAAIARDLGDNALATELAAGHTLALDAAIDEGLKGLGLSLLPDA